MLAVIAVIGILVSILFKLASYVSDKIERNDAEVDIEGVRAMLAEYKMTRELYPQTTGLRRESDRMGRCFMALAGLVDSTGKPYPAGSKRASVVRGKWSIRGRVDEYDIYQGGGTRYNIYLLDPWEQSYVYFCPAPDGDRDYLLFSKGPDGRASTDSDGKEEDDEDNIPSNYPSGDL